MDPLTIASGVIALSGLSVAWRMHRRARRAETEAATLRSEVLWQRGTRGPQANQGPWRMPAGAPRQRAYPSSRPQLTNSTSRPPAGMASGPARGLPAPWTPAIPAPRRPIDPTSPE